jgi:site-specific DNA recombinase
VLVCRECGYSYYLHQHPHEQQADQSTLRAQLDALDAELHDAETYLKLADTLEGFPGRLADGLGQLEIAEQQRILRLVVREVLIGGDDDTITIRHSIPTPAGPHDPGYLLRGSSHLAAPVQRLSTPA